MLPIPRFNYTKPTQSSSSDALAILATSLLWYDLNLATASVDANDKNTIQSGRFTRLWNIATSSYHLVANATAFGYDLRYQYDTDKSLYIGNAQNTFGAFTSSTPLSTQNDLTLFCTFRTPVSFSAKTKLFSITGASYSLDLMCYNTPNQVRLQHGYISSYTASIINVATQSWFLVVATFSHNNGTITSPKVYANGVLATQSALGDGISWGSANVILHSGFTYDIRYAEVVLFNKNLSSSEIISVETYLKNKWSISY